MPIRVSNTPCREFLVGAKAEIRRRHITLQHVLLGVDQAFYNALQAHAVLRVPEQTVASRQWLADQVSALTASKLKSDLDLSFANVNLAQAKVLCLDVLNRAKLPRQPFRRFSDIPRSKYSNS